VDTEFVFPLLIVLFMGGACLLAVLLLSGMGLVAFRFYRRRSQIFQEADQALETDTGAYLAEAEAQMLSWESGALGDFSSHLAITGRSVVSSLHYRGELKSLEQPEAPGWLAFDLQLHRGKGPMELRTRGGSYHLDIGIASAQVRADGIPLGSIRLRGRTCIFLGVNERPLGRYTFKSRGWVLRYSAGYFRPTYNPVEIRGRQVAEFNANMVLGQQLELLKEPLPPLYTNLAVDLADEEVDWLITLLGWGIYRRIGEHISR
jgi:hypothetical protein